MTDVPIYLIEKISQKNNEKGGGTHRRGRGQISLLIDGVVSVKKRMVLFN
jgi:hypothetical protein